MKVFLPLLFLALTGCTTANFTETTQRLDKAGKIESVSSRTFNVNRFGLDTKFGKLGVETPEGGTLNLENYDSQTKLIELMAEVAKIVGKAKP